jgi:hypothetical protein
MSSNALATRNLDALLTVKPFVPKAVLQQHLYQLAPWKEGTNYNAMWGEYQGDGMPLEPVHDEIGAFLNTLNPAFIDGVGIYVGDQTDPDPLSFKFNLHLVEKGHRTTLTCGLSTVGAHYAYAALYHIFTNDLLDTPVQIHAKRGYKSKYNPGIIQIIQNGQVVPTDGWEKFQVMKQRFQRALLPYRNLANGGDPITSKQIDDVAEALNFYEQFNNQFNHVLKQHPIDSGDSTQAIEAEVSA